VQRFARMGSNPSPSAYVNDWIASVRTLLGAAAPVARAMIATWTSATSSFAT
jgi:hypothetical protein